VSYEGLTHLCAGGSFFPTVNFRLRPNGPKRFFVFECELLGRSGDGSARPRTRWRTLWHYLRVRAKREYGWRCIQSDAGGEIYCPSHLHGCGRSNPEGGLTLGLDGNYYGAATFGGASGAGTLFKVSPTGIFTLLYQFSASSDGGYPNAPPIQAADGNLYGTTAGSSASDGTVYKYSPSSGALTTILSLETDGTQGQYFGSALLQTTDRTLYGATEKGGASGCGAIVHLTTSGNLLNVYSFTCGSGGSRPISALIQASDGNLYGTTSEGGNTTSNRDCAFGCGTIFRLSDGAISTLYAFSGEPTDGGLPIAGLVEGTDGQMYGSTHEGAPTTSERSTVFRRAANTSCFTTSLRELA
jgi:uncharacterized repeat protein (TIGR03803 family)